MRGVYRVVKILCRFLYIRELKSQMEQVSLCCDFVAKIKLLMRTQYFVCFSVNSVLIKNRFAISNIKYRSRCEELPYFHSNLTQYKVSYGNDIFKNFYCIGLIEEKYFAIFASSPFGKMYNDLIEFEERIL